MLKFVDTPVAKKWRPSIKDGVTTGGARNKPRSNRVKKAEQNPNEDVWRVMQMVGFTLSFHGDSELARRALEIVRSTLDGAEGGSDG